MIPTRDPPPRQRLDADPDRTPPRSSTRSRSAVFGPPGCRCASRTSARARCLSGTRSRAVGPRLPQPLRGLASSQQRLPAPWSALVDEPGSVRASSSAPTTRGIRPRLRLSRHAALHPEAGIPTTIRALRHDRVKGSTRPTRPPSGSRRRVGVPVFVASPRLASLLESSSTFRAAAATARRAAPRRRPYERANWKLSARTPGVYTCPGCIGAREGVPDGGTPLQVPGCTSASVRPIAANTDDGGWEGLPPMAGLSEAPRSRQVAGVSRARDNSLPNHTFLSSREPPRGAHERGHLSLAHPSRALRTARRG